MAGVFVEVIFLVFEIFIRLKCSLINRWASKKTITDKVLNPVRTQEANILSALKGSDYQEGDKVYLYYTERGALKRVDDWSNDHSKKRLHEKLKNAMKVLDGVL